MPHDLASGTSDRVTYVPDPATLWSSGILTMLCMFPSGIAAFELWSIPVNMIRYGWGLPLAVVAVLFGMAGAQICLGAWQRSFGVTVTPAGVRACAKAQIIGPGVSGNLRRQAELSILDGFTIPIATMINKLNAMRPQRSGNESMRTTSAWAALRQDGGASA